MDSTGYLVLDRLMKHPLFKKLSKAKQEQYQSYREELSKSLQQQVLHTSVSDALNVTLRSYYTQNFRDLGNYDPYFSDLL